MKRRRRGNVLILVVMLLFAIISLAALVVDLGLVRLTQTRLQSVSDASALEAAWVMPNDPNASGDFLATRIAADTRASDSTEFSAFENVTAPTDPDLGLGPREVILTGGFDLNGDGVNESGRLITLGDRVEAQLNLNTGNADGGDIVVGSYDADQVPSNLPPAPGAPNPFDRSPAFAPATDSMANSVLVRLRRTGSTDADVLGASTGGRLPVLFGALSHFGTEGSPGAFQQRAEGFAVRSESIAALFPAVAVGPPLSTGDDAQGTQLAAQLADSSIDRNEITVLPAAVPFSVDASVWPNIVAAQASGLAVPVVSIDQANFNYQLGSLVTAGSTPVIDSTGYLSITFQNRIVAFGMVQINAVADPDQEPIVTAIELTGNASADLRAAMDGLNGVPVAEFEQLKDTANGLTGIVMAPRLVRSNRISP